MTQNHTARLLGTASLLALLALLPPAEALAGGVLPTGGTVAAGGATIGKPVSGGLTINQSTSRAVIDWTSFSVGQSNRVTFVQPNAGSATLNRVTGGTTSTIAGSIVANGSVYLVNPNGIQITATGTVNTGAGFVASSLDIANSDFMAGKTAFAGNGASASVRNAGKIITGPVGFVALLGGSVSNGGLIYAPLGKIGLGSGEMATLDVNGDQFLQVSLPTGATDANGQALVTNTGKLIASGGQVVITAATAKQAVRDAINMPGSINASSVSGHSGSVTLDGGAGGNVALSGQISAGGGEVAVSGANIALNGAAIDVSGASGGGSVSIGGKNTGEQAASVSVDAASSIKADGLGAGDGGAITLWSTGQTAVHGLLSAQGGAVSGAGGLVETSGQTVDFTGATVKTAAPNGLGGTWLLDPEDLTIEASDAATIAAALIGGTSVTLTTNASGAPTETGVTGLGATASGNGDININSAIAWTGTAALTLQAYNNINISAAVSLGAGTLSLYAAGATGSSTPGTTTGLTTGAITINAPITISGAGTVNLKANSLSSLTVDSVTTTFSPTDLELSFGTGGSISYGATNNGGRLNINGTAYTLLYKLSDGADTAPDTGTDDIAGIDQANDSGHYALATSLSNSLTFTSALAGAGDDTGAGKNFSGTFEGLGNTITGLTILSNAPSQFIGLFGQSSGTIRDVVLSGGTITTGSAVVGTDSVGSLLGMNFQGLVANDSTSTVVSGSGGIGYTTSGSNAFGGGVGGLVGANVGGNVMQSHATGAVTDVYGLAFDSTGGLVGTNSGNIDINGITALGGASTATILYSYATGQVTGSNDDSNGGLVGWNSGTGSYSGSVSVGTANIIGSWASGAVSGYYVLNTANSGINESSSGGLVGANQDGYGSSGNASIIDSYATGAVSTSGGTAGGYNGGLIGGSAVFWGGTLSVKYSYATGSVTGLSGDNLGGAIGGDYSRDYSSNTYGVNTNVYYSNGVSDPSGATGVSVSTLEGSLLTGLSSAVWTAGASGNGNSGFPIITLNSLTTAITYLVADATSTYGTLASLGSVTFSGSPSNLSGTISLYNSSNTLVTLSAGLPAGAYTEKVTALTGAAAPGYSIATTGNTFGTLTIDKASLTITANNQTKVYGAPLPTLTASYTGFVNGDTAASLTTAPAISTAATSASPANTYAITASGAVSSNYTISYVPGTLTISKAALTITADNQSSIYGGALPTLTASYSGFVNGDTAASLTTAPAISTAATSASPANTYAITAAGAVDNNYTISYVAGTLTIAKAPLTITADNEASTYGGSVPTLTASYSGLVNGDTAASLTTAPAISTAATPASPANTYAITASGAVDNNYTINYLAGTLTIAKAALTITADNQSSTYGGALPTLTASYSGFANGDTAASLTTAPTLVTTGTSASPANTYTITASGAVDNNYTISYAPGTLTIAKAALTITADNQTKVYGAPLPTLTASYTGFVNGDTAASLTTAPTISTAGTSASPANTYAITAAGAVDNNYTINYLAGTLTISKAALTITADNQSSTYGAPLPTLTASYTGFVNGDTAASLTTAPAISTAATSASPANTYAITASGAVSSNYTISYVPGTLTISKAALTITADNQSSIYGGALPTLTASYSGFVNGDTAASLTTAPAISTAATSASPANTYAITAAGAVDNNYTISYVAGTLTIAKAPLTITADNQASTYGGSVPTLTASYSGLVNGDTAASLTTAPAISTAATPASPANTYAITASGAVDNNYTISYVAGTLTIGKAALTITADNQASTYGGSVPTLTASYGGLVNGDTAVSLTTAPTLATTGTSASNVGNYAITASGAVDNNYTISYVAGTLAINPASVNVTNVANASSTYGTLATLGAATLTGVIAGDAANVQSTVGVFSGSTPVTLTAGTAAGTYAEKVTGLTGSAASNYTIVNAGSTPGTLTINKAALTITANNQGSTYGGALPTLTASYSGFVNGDNAGSLTTAPTISTAATSASPANTYVITASGAVSSNYTISYVPGTLTISKAALTITADNQASTYGGALPTLTASYSGFVNGDTAASLTTAPTISTAATSASNAGPYAITPSGAVDNNYTISYAPGTLTIGKAALTITTNNQTMTYGAGLPALTATYAGLVNGDTASSLTTGPTISTTGTSASNVGSYAITASGAVDNNYTISYGPGALTVNPAEITVTANSGSSVYGSTPINPGLSATGLQNGQTVSVLTGLTNSFGLTAASPVGAGPYTLSVAGTLTNANYTIVQRNAGAWTIDPATLTYTAAPASRMSGIVNPTFSGTVSGFVLADTQANATTGTLAFSSPAAPGALPGSYAITGAGLTADNGDYVFVQAPGNTAALTVTSGATALPDRVTPPTILSLNPWFMADLGGPDAYSQLDVFVDLNAPAPPQHRDLGTCFATGLGTPVACFSH